MSSKRPTGSEDASGPHEFVEPEDPRLGISLGTGQQSGRSSSVGMAILAEASTRAPRCALPGCGKERQDPIHWPAT